jgi:hypothetical protein
MAATKKGAAKKASSKTASKKGATKKATTKAATKTATKKAQKETEDARFKATPKKGAGGIGQELDEELGQRTNLEGNASSKGKQMYGGNQAMPLDQRENGGQMQ